MPNRAVPFYTLNDKITLRQLRAFVACAERKSYSDAARALRQERQAVKPQITSLEKALNGSRLFEDVRQGDRLLITTHGNNLLPYARAMIDNWAALARTAATACSVAYLPQHGYVIAAAKRRLTTAGEAGTVLIEDNGLSEEHRDVDVFEHQVVGPVAEGAIDLAIGLPPKTERKDLVVETLYRARLEAMIDVNDERDRVTVPELVDIGGLLIPPPTTRSYRTLDQAFQKHVPEKTLADVTNLVRQGTKVLVSHGLQRLGTVIVPSDIAYPFKEGHMFGGPESRSFKWVAVVAPDNNKELTHRVVYFHRRDPLNDNLPRVIEAIKAAVDEVGLNRK